MRAWKGLPLAIFNLLIVQTSYTWIKDTSAPTAILTGAPTGTNNTTSLNVVVSGTDVVYYQFKIGETSSTVCSNATGYSSDIAVAQSIQSNISALANGGVTLCVIGKDSGGNYQSMASSNYCRLDKRHRIANYFFGPVRL
jgi:hypothetical protein